MKRILVVNDDGIRADGIAALAELAKTLGEVTVVAPAAQCSAMSHKITISYPIRVEEVTDFPVDGVTAYRLEGTPADCTMLGICSIMDETPDLVLSGINDGYNAGFDTIYSGTVGAAREALLHDVPGIAFSIGRDFVTGDFAAAKSSAKKDRYRIVRENFAELMQYVEEHPAPDNAVININFPMCGVEGLKGIRYDVSCARQEFYGITSFSKEISEDGAFLYMPEGMYPTSAPAGTDMEAVLDDYISVGLVTCAVLRK